MSSRKGQNSIIFLATLGVYLGLVLAGGTAPQVYAYAATTRAFDAREEIELGDDFFGPPEGDERSSVTESLSVYVDDVEQLVNALKRYSAKGSFDVSRDFFEVNQNSYLPCVSSNIRGSYTPEKFVSVSTAVRPTLERFSKQTTYGYSLGDCLQNPHFAENTSTDSRTLFKLDESGLTVQIKVKKESRQAAESLASDLRDVAARMLSKENLPVRAAILKETSFQIENDQVFVITRLPRAALDPLLANDAK